MTHDRLVIFMCCMEKVVNVLRVDRHSKGEKLHRKRFAQVEASDHNVQLTA